MASRPTRCITGRHEGRHALTLVGIIDASRYQNHNHEKGPLATSITPFKGMFDTGATSTMISQRVVEQAGLEPAGRTKFRGLGGDHWRPIYLFHAAFPDGIVNWHDPYTEQASPVDRFQVCKRIITGGQLSDQSSFDILIGMDIITTGTFTIRADGTFTFKF